MFKIKIKSKYIYLDGNEVSFKEILDKYKDIDSVYAEFHLNNLIIYESFSISKEGLVVSTSNMISLKDIPEGSIIIKVIVPSFQK